MSLVFGSASKSKQESTAEHVDDSVITGKIKPAIAEASEMHVTEINVGTYTDVVRLSGFVYTQTDINRVGSLARDMKLKMAGSTLESPAG